MNLTQPQLLSHCQQALKSIYLISGDETLLIQESCDAVRAAARKQGFVEREIFDIEPKSSWDDIIHSANSMSLFADRKLIELRFKSAKIGDDGSKGIFSLLENLNPDIVFLLVMPKVESATKNSKWHKALEAQGVVVAVWPVDRAHLPAWIKTRLHEHHLNASEDAVHFLADNVEGNLLAAHQEIEKLVLLKKNNDSMAIDLETVTQFISNSSRYTVFNLADRCYEGDLTGALRTLNGLKAEDPAPHAILPILGYLTRELRTLHRLQFALQQGMPVFQALESERIFKTRQPMVQKALQRMPMKKIENLIRKARLVDQCIKGISDESAWLHLEQLTLAFASR